MTDTGIETATMPDGAEVAQEEQQHEDGEQAALPCRVREAGDGLADGHALVGAHVDSTRAGGGSALQIAATAAFTRVDHLHGVAALHLLHVDEHRVRGLRGRGRPHVLLLRQGVEATSATSLEEHRHALAEPTRTCGCRRADGELPDRAQHHGAVAEADRAAGEAHVVRRRRPARTCETGTPRGREASRSSRTVTAALPAPVYRRRRPRPPAARSAGRICFSTRRRTSMPGSGVEKVRVSTGSTWGLNLKIAERSAPSGRSPRSS